MRKLHCPIDVWTLAARFIQTASEDEDTVERHGQFLEMSIADATGCGVGLTSVN